MIGQCIPDMGGPNEIFELQEEWGDPVGPPSSLPKYLRLIGYWNLPEAFAMFRDSCPNLFWTRRCSNDPNPSIPASRRSGSVQKNPEKSAAQQRVAYDPSATPQWRGKTRQYVPNSRQR